MGQRFTPEELKVIRQEVEKNEPLLTKKRTLELALLLGRSEGSIRCKYSREKEKYSKWFGDDPPMEVKPIKPKGIEATESKSLGETLEDIVHQLHRLADMTRKIAEEVQLQDKWIQDTIILKRKLKIRMSRDGLVESIEHEEEK
jgi:hypothetical protein